jgi:hypothetical protein
MLIEDAEIRALVEKNLPKMLEDAFVDKYDSRSRKPSKKRFKGQDGLIRTMVREVIGSITTDATFRGKIGEAVIENHRKRTEALTDALQKTTLERASSSNAEEMEEAVEDCRRSFGAIDSLRALSHAVKNCSTLDAGSVPNVPLASHHSAYSRMKRWARMNSRHSGWRSWCSSTQHSSRLTGLLQWSQKIISVSRV